MNSISLDHHWQNGYPSTMTKTVKKQERETSTPKNCFFCAKGIEPSFKEPRVLKLFLNKVGEIKHKYQVGKGRHGTLYETCHRHRLRVARNIKTARELGLLSYQVRE